jgi:preprotein translocase subunit YajC
MDLYCSHAILAQAGPPPPNPGNLLVGPLVPMMIILITVFYITNRSQRKKIKEHEQKLNTLKPGDKILTSGGLLGVVITVKEKSLTFRSADAKLEIAKSAVTEITERGGASGES